MSGNYQNLKQMFCLTISFNFFPVVNKVLANICHGEYSKCHPVAWIQAYRQLRHWSMPSSITLCSTPTYTSVRRRLKSCTSCDFSGRLVAPDFVINCIDVRAVQCPEICKFVWSYITTLSDLRQRMMQRRSAYTQLPEKITTSRIYQSDNVISQRI